MLRTFLYFLLTLAVSAADRRLVLTFDDLPRGGDSSSSDLAELTALTRKLTTPLRGTHAACFINPGSRKSRDLGPAALQSILKIWRDAGIELGSHTNTHPSLHQVPLAEYIENIKAAEPAIIEARPGKSRPRYFRHPFLNTGRTLEIKRGLEDFLAGNGYRIAPVTIDTADYVYAAAYKRAPAADAARVRAAYLEHLESATAFFEKRAVEVVGREIPQIILLHANQLNADTIPQTLAMFKRRGYRFVSLDEALRDPAYKLPDTYIGPAGQSWIHRWAFSKGMPHVDEPDPPKWIMDLYPR